MNNVRDSVAERRNSSSRNSLPCDIEPDPLGYGLDLAWIFPKLSFILLDDGSHRI